MSTSALQRRSEAVAAITLIVLGGVIWHQGDAIPPSFMDTGFGAGLLPEWLGATVALLSALLLLETVTSGRPSARREREQAEPVASEAGQQRSWWLKPCVLVLLLVSLLTNIGYQWVPFYLSVAVFIFLTILLLEGVGRRALMIATCVSLATTGVVWMVFSQLFMVIIQ